MGGWRACARFPLDLTGFEEGAVIGTASCLYRRVQDGMEIAVAASDVPDFDLGEVEIEIANLSNLRHPPIMAPIGFYCGFSEGEGKLRIGRKHAAGDSRAEVVSFNPAWCTPTVKAEAVV
jgi:hypothetical protein